MHVQLTVLYEDGTSGIVVIENPPGAHPDSVLTAITGLVEAEKSGKRVARIGRSKVNPFSTPGKPLVIDDSLVITREELLRNLTR